MSAVGHREHLGVGWTFPLRISATGGLSYSRYEQDIAEAIWIVLGTAPGERRTLPRFGCGIHQYVFAPINTATLGDVAFQVREALTEWEPRIDLLDVAVSADPAEPVRLLVEVDYSVRATNSRFNLVYPFYLQQPA